jgi:hypothetical protein
VTPGRTDAPVESWPPRQFGIEKQAVGPGGVISFANPRPKDRLVLGQPASAKGRQHRPEFPIDGETVARCRGRTSRSASAKRNGLAAKRGGGNLAALGTRRDAPSGEIAAQGERRLLAALKADIDERIARNEKGRPPPLVAQVGDETVETVLESEAQTRRTPKGPDLAPGAEARSSAASPVPTVSASVSLNRAALNQAASCPAGMKAASSSATAGPAPRPSAVATATADRPRHAIRPPIVPIRSPKTVRPIIVKMGCRKRECLFRPNPQTVEES